MIRTFRSKALADLWFGRRSKIDTRFHRRILVRLDRLDTAVIADEMNLAGFDFHKLRGKPVRFTVHVNGPWCMTFEFVGRDAFEVDFEQYH